MTPLYLIRSYYEVVTMLNTELVKLASWLKATRILLNVKKNYAVNTGRCDFKMIIMLP